MSLRLFSLILVVGGILTFYLYSSEPPTSEIWRVKANVEITTQPAFTGDKAYFLLRQLQIAAIDTSGNITGPVQLDSQARHPLVAIASGVLVADRDGGYTFYSPELVQLWKRATIAPSDVQPIPLPGNRLVVSAAHEVLFGLDGKTGNALWESHFDGSVVHAVPGETIAVVYGYDDLKKPSWKLCAIDPEDGSIIWKYPDPIDDGTPLVYSGYFLFCDKDGRPVAVSQQTGEVAYRHDTAGYKLAGVTGNSLLLLAAGGTRMDFCNLPTGKSWSVTLPSPFLAALTVGDALLFADGRSIKCIEAQTGVIRWQQDLGKTFDFFVHENALGITYKDNFLARRTRVTLFTPDRNSTIWTALDSGRFYRPMMMPQGDLLICRSGNIRLMPRPETASAPEEIASGTNSPPFDAFFQVPPRPAATAALPAPAVPAPETPVASKQPVIPEPPLHEDPAEPDLSTPAARPPAPLASDSGW